LNACFEEKKYPNHQRTIFLDSEEEKNGALMFVQLELPMGSCPAKYGGDGSGVQNDSNNNVAHM
jgi:hypothetical protein